MEDSVEKPGSQSLPVETKPEREMGKEDIEDCALLPKPERGMGEEKEMEDSVEE